MILQNEANGIEVAGRQSESVDEVVQLHESASETIDLMERGELGVSDDKKLITFLREQGNVKKVVDCSLLTANAFQLHSVVKRDQPDWKFPFALLVISIMLQVCIFPSCVAS